MPRFVILTHDWPFLHWDLMLEADAALRTWRLLEEPGPGRSVPAEPLPDHRRAYLDYEGPVSGDRGTVARWDAGEFTWTEEADRALRLHLHGTRLSGPVIIRSVSPERATVTFVPGERG
jgi:hypothetical protein